MTRAEQERLTFWENWKNRPVRIIDRALGFPVGIVSGLEKKKDKTLVKVSIMTSSGKANFDFDPLILAPLTKAGNLSTWHRVEFMARNGKPGWAPEINPPTCVLCMTQTEPGEAIVVASVAWDDRRGETSWAAHTSCAESASNSI